MKSTALKKVLKNVVQESHDEVIPFEIASDESLRMSDRTTGKRSRTANYVTTMTTEPQDQMDEDTIKKNYVKLLKDCKYRVFI